MSTNWALRSKGLPQFSMLQKSLLNMGIENMGGGIAYIEAEIKINTLPPMASVETELHPFFGIVQRSGIFRIFDFGVTPSGRIGCAIGASYTLQSGQGALNPAMGWVTVSLNYDYGTGNVFIQIDGVDAAADLTTSAPIPYPDNSYPYQLVMFNGKGLTARTDISMRRLLMFSPGTGLVKATYSFAERGGLVIDADHFDPSAYPDASLALTGMHQGIILSGGSVATPSSDPHDNFQWVVSTEYTKRAIPKTAYTRSGR